MIPIISICLPTYKRAHRIKDSLENLTKIENDEIEIIVIDDCSPDNTSEIIQSFKDKRIKYYRNEKNLGQERNVLHTFELAKGEFVFLISDEDVFENQNLPYLIEVIKSNPNVSQIFGGIWDDEKGEYYYNPGDRYYKKGAESLSELMFCHGYFSGQMFRRIHLDLIDTDRYFGSAYIHYYLSAPIMLRGDTLCTSKIVCRLGPAEQVHTFEKFVSTKKKIPFFHIRSRIIQMIFNIKLIIQITRGKPKLRRMLIRKNIKLNTLLLAKSAFEGKPFLIGLREFLEAFPHIIRVKYYSKQLYFWEQLVLFILKTNKRNFQNKTKQLL